MAGNATGGAVTVVGLEKILRKMDDKVLTKPALLDVFKSTANAGRAFLAAGLSSEFPITSSRVMSESSDALASISAPSKPYIFFERGSQYPAAGRAHVRRRGVKTGALRIKPRRHLAKTRAKLRKDLPGLIERARQRIEQTWGAA